MDALKVVGGGYWWVCTRPSRRGRRERSVSVHLHAARVVPARGLTEEEKHGAGDLHVSWEVEVVTSLGLQSTPPGNATYTSTVIHLCKLLFLWSVFYTCVPLDSLNIRINIDMSNF